jgi:hypothetical protein
MDRITPATDILLRLLIPLRDFVIAFVFGIELWLRAPLQRIGVPDMAQTVILFAAAGFMIMASLQLFDGLVRVTFVLFLSLLAVNIALSVVWG